MTTTRSPLDTAGRIALTVTLGLMAPLAALGDVIGAVMGGDSPDLTQGITRTIGRIWRPDAPA